MNASTNHLLPLSPACPGCGWPRANPQGVSPHIDETLTFQDVRAAPGDYIDLAVRHRTGGTAAAKNLKSVRLGYVRVSFEDVMRATSGLKSTWSLLECESGSISCSLTWVSLAEEEKRAASFDAA